MKMADKKATLETKFKKETVRQISKTSFHNSKTKYSPDSLLLTTEMLKVYVVEAAHRAAYQANSEGAAVVQLEHLEKILPQFLMDFV